MLLRKEVSEVMVKNALNPMFLLLTLMLLAAFSGTAAETKKSSDTFPSSKVEVRVFSPEQVAKPDLVPDAAGEDAAKAPTDPLDKVLLEIQVVRDELRMLQSTLDLMINHIMADMQEENRVLREEVQRLYLIQKEFGIPDTTHIPRPGIGIIRGLLQAVPGMEEKDTPVTPEQSGASFLPDDGGQVPEEADSGAPAEPASLTILHEWGRSPEMVEELDHAVSTLKGLVGVVPPESRRADVEELGRQLRARYDDYENINIEIFDDQKSAENYVDTQVGDPDHRVLSISRHSASGRDLILYLDKGEAKEVSP